MYTVREKKNSFTLRSVSISLDWLVIILIPITEILFDNEANREYKPEIERERGKEPNSVFTSSVVFFRHKN